MKKVFSILLAASLMLLGTQAFAQMSVNAGYLNSNRTSKDSKAASANGAYAGVSFNIRKKAFIRLSYSFNDMKCGT